MTPDGGARRVLRGTSVGAAAVAISLAGHLGAGGAAPPAPALAVMAAVAWVVGIVVAGRRVGFGRALVALLALQPVLHLTLTLTGHHHDEVTSSAASSNGPMVVGHVVAAAALAWWLAQGDALLWRATARAARRVIVLVPPHIATPTLRLPIDDERTTPVVRTEDFSDRRRGPPAGAVHVPTIREASACSV